MITHKYKFVYSIQYSIVTNIILFITRNDCWIINYV